MEKNFIWTQNPSEAYSNPYEYETQKQFSRECFKVLNGFKACLEIYNTTFLSDDKSVEKAIWMLLTDATDSLLECHRFLLQKKHKIAGRLFRDAIEVIDLSSLFMAKTAKSSRLLDKWYNNQVIPNREYRNFIEKSRGSDISENYRNFYSQISKFNHRTYKSLAFGYILNKNGTLVYDGFTSHLNDYNSLIFPGIISMYYALLANITSILSITLKQSGLINKEAIDKIWTNSIEEVPKKRHFMSSLHIAPERFEIKNKKK